MGFGFWLLALTPPKAPEVPNHATVDGGYVHHLFPGRTIRSEAGFVHLLTELAQGGDQGQCRHQEAVKYFVSCVFNPIVGWALPTNAGAVVYD